MRLRCQSYTTRWNTTAHGAGLAVVAEQQQTRAGHAADLQHPQFGITAVLGAVVYSADQNRRTVVVPFASGGDLYVTGSTPSADYLKAMTRNIVALAGTYSAYPTPVAFRDTVLLGQQIVERIEPDVLMPIAEAFWLLFGVHRPAGPALGAER